MIPASLRNKAIKRNNVISIKASASPENALIRMVKSYGSAITVAQLAKVLQCSKRHIYSLVEQNRLPALRVGTMIRLDPGSVASWIEVRMTIVASDKVAA